MLRENPFSVRIEGHVAGPDEDDATERNFEGDNKQLSHNRAQRVVEFLIAHGVDAQLLTPEVSPSRAARVCVSTCVTVCHRRADRDGR